MKKTIRVKDGKNLMFISVRCNDECKNGHDTFAITGSYFEPSRRTNDPDYKVIDDKGYINTMGGCLHDDIERLRPDLKPFINLHLSDGDGVPMYVINNGYYHLQGYMGTARHDHKMTRKGVADYLRITENEVQQLADKKPTKIEFVDFLISKRPQWKAEAEEAKNILKTLS